MPVAKRNPIRRGATPGRSAGRYNVPAAIEQNQPTTNADGQLVANWVQVASDWFEVLSNGGKERWLYQEVRAEVLHIVRVKYSAQTAAIKPATYRINIGSGAQILNIDAAYDIDNRRIEIELQCTEVEI